ncbi:Glycosyl hydrolases family 16 [Catalinimonas alkaloidigena]|uniref:Glycosyl hydrolases family 16 n=1 Tax=Catalinimonas alkaloidigena TaxID=1075417 RepID=A0A1G9RAH7_9BACT|nr:glycoside hydrolase family 16 protein [Catalinimonas alkaloidigena]SDM19857.1 Glycosyl hydrolases family 16 [Catalinimonas alkaloidigena]
MSTLKPLLKVLLGAALLTTAACASRQPTTAPDGWQLVWSDEFDQDGPPDPANWTFETGFVRNEEAQWYQPQNARCADGLLRIEARRETLPNPHYDPKGTDWRTRRPQADYTSACLTTQGLHQWQYGRFEMRGRIDTRAGRWPAFWTLGVEGEWPRNGEIDIMEYYRGMLLANVAWGTSERWQAHWDDTHLPLDSLGDAAWSDRFHIWRMDWDADHIRLYVDDRLLNETDLHTTRNEDGTGKNPFHQPHYLLLNLAIGGMNGGDPTPTEFPARFEVDYVRVYQRTNGRP